VATDRRDFLAQQIGQLESNNNPGIGYHNRSRSTAYGQYGFTAPTWAGLRRTDPTLPADITQATPEQQRAAFDQLNAANGQQLAGYGLPVNTGSVALAHLLGAAGARDYMQNRTLSPEASAANGGEDALRRIADQRLAMLAPGEMPEQYVRELPAVASGPEMASGTTMASAATAAPEAGGAAPADAGDGAGWAKALEFAGKALSKQGRASVGPDAASIVKPRTFADPEAGEMLPRQRARAIAAILQRDMV
tara:strand:- start:4962 stop:5711 length:750 start_codon:yes stop_codon:yes gene_type:complete